MKKIMDKENIIVVDFDVDESWNFLREISFFTKENRIIKKKVSNKNRFSKLDNLIRYFKYFSYSWKLFIQRKKFRTIISWQQFNGIIISFFLKLFKCKKVNKIIVMTFIYKRKKGLFGRIYHSFVKYSIDSKYIDKIICFSSTEPSFYSNLFGIPLDKFVYIPLGEDLPVFSNTSDNRKSGAIAIGLSNRDNDFLISVFKELDLNLTIYCNCDKVIAPNIVMKSDYLGDNVANILSNYKILVMALLDPKISAGQLTVLHAMQLGIPVVVSNSDGIKDFIIDNNTGFILDKNIQIWKEKIKLLIEDDDLYRSISINAQIKYKREHTIKSMACNIADVIINQEDKN